MNIVFAASEAAPYIKTGGLGDVARALPLALSEKKGQEVSLFLPYYGKIKRDPSVKTEFVKSFLVPLSWREQYCGIFRLKSKKRKFKVYFLDNEYYFDRDPIYGHGDDGERFAFFSKAILESLCQMGMSPDIIHVNDWQTACLPTLLHAFYHDTLGKAKTVFTIHNIEYQGWADPYFLGDTLGLSADYESTFSFRGAVNFLKSAVLSSDAVTTVSESYARELCDPAFAHGLHEILASHAFKTCGIVNGIDPEDVDPQTDSGIARNYGVKNVAQGKAFCKRALQEEAGLPLREDVPLVGMVSRLVSHKGMDLVCPALEEWMDWDVQFVILGTGDASYEERLAALSARHPDKFAFIRRFSPVLSSRIYAACDIFLMPSRSEPCGLSQMMAMRFGTVPVVHETGGLRDTVPPFDPETGKGLGFSFSNFDREGLNWAFRQALTLYATDKEAWQKLVTNGMTTDFSWKKGAEAYLSLYRSLTEIK